MKIKVTLMPGNGKITKNYLHPLQSFIYNILRKMDKELADDIHNYRYGKGKRKIKPFGFSTLKFEQGYMDLGEEIAFGGTTSFYINTPYEEIGRLIFLGIKLEKEMHLSNEKFSIVDVKIDRDKEYSTECVFSTISEACVRYKDDKEVHYPLPSDKLYIDYLIKNIQNKYFMYYGENLDKEISIEIMNKNTDYENTQKKRHFMDGWFKVNFLFFKVKCEDTKVMQIIDQWGIGQYNSMGFGAVQLERAA